MLGSRDRRPAQLPRVPRTDHAACRRAGPGNAPYASGAPTRGTTRAAGARTERNGVGRMHGLELTCGSATHPGMRAENQDRYLAAPPVFAIADGMGGHAEGAAASEAVVRRLGALAGGGAPPAAGGGP